MRFEPRTADFQSWPIPGGGDIVRNTSVARDGAIVLANSLVNQITVLRVQRSR